MRKMTAETLANEVRSGLSKRLRVEPSDLNIEIFPWANTVMIGLDVKINGNEPTEPQKALIKNYLRETVDPRAIEAGSC